MPFISIIIPVYNSEKYLELSVGSVLKQTFTDWELILINDGSTDSSLTLCKKYEQNDSRIHVFSQDNAGQASARNLGLQNASGKYISFLDSDDSFSNDTLLENIKILQHNEAIECLQFPITHRYGSPEEYCALHDEYFFDKRDQILSAWLGKDIISWIVCNKIFKNSAISKLKFQEGMVYEDNYFVIDVIKAVNNLYVSKKGMYNYFSRENSTTTSVHTLQKELDTLKVLTHLLDNFNFKEKENLYVKYLVRIVNIEKSIYYNFKQMSNNQFKYIKNLSLLSIIRSNTNLKDKIKLLAVKIK